MMLIVQPLAIPKALNCTSSLNRTQGYDIPYSTQCSPTIVPKAQTTCQPLIVLNAPTFSQHSVSNLQLYLRIRNVDRPLAIPKASNYGATLSRTQGPNASLNLIVISLFAPFPFMNTIFQTSLSHHCTKMHESYNIHLNHAFAEIHRKRQDAFNIVHIHIQQYLSNQYAFIHKTTYQHLNMLYILKSIQ